MRWIIVGFLWVLMIFCRSKIVLCIPMVFKVTDFMGGCQYLIVSEV